MSHDGTYGSDIVNIPTRAQLEALEDQLRRLMEPEATPLLFIQKGLGVEVPAYLRAALNRSVGPLATLEQLAREVAALERAECGCFQEAVPTDDSGRRGGAAGAGRGATPSPFTPRAGANLVRLHRREARRWSPVLVVRSPWSEPPLTPTSVPFVAIRWDEPLVFEVERLSLEDVGGRGQWTPLGWQHALRQAVARRAPVHLVMDALEALE